MDYAPKAVRLSGWALTIALAAALAVLGLSMARAATAASVTPAFVAGNPTCPDLGYDFGFKADPPNAGTYNVGSLGTITVTRVGESFNWTSTFGIDAVIAKGGPNANEYVYDPPSESFGDTNLVAPTNPQNGQPFGLSHIEFCYDINLEVTKTAATTFRRDYDWTIAKTNASGSSAADPLTIQDGQPIDVNYEVAVTKDGGTDSNWEASGTIAVKNPHPSAAATGVAVSDVITPGNIGATVDCDPNTGGNQNSGLTIAAGATLNCTYGPVSLPDGTTRLNTATATTTTQGIGGGSGTADVTFGAPTTVLDNCIDVNDTFGEGPDENICASKTYNYTVTFNTVDHPLECGESSVTNTASIATDDGQTETATSTVWFDKLCGGDGCTLTQGYWKTHSEYGPAAHPDDTWDSVGGPDASFYLSGKTWYEVFWTAPAGNAYYNLAHQFMAAKLNVLAGADTTANVDAALAAAHTFFSTYTPSSWPKAQKNTILGYANTLDQYNNGVIGPGHCDGDVTS